VSDYKRPYHNPRGNPCDCGAPFLSHRVAHAPQGVPCRKCGLPESNHYRKPHTYADSWYPVGIDGEGQGRDDHKYVLLAWSNESGTRTAHVKAAPGERLTTVQCLDFILELPIAAHAFGFAFGYDLTKILHDVDDAVLFRLFRSELRRPPPGKEKNGPVAVRWNGYSLNIQGAKFSVTKGKRRRVIWDCFKFYQSKFTTALDDWYRPQKGAPDDPKWPAVQADIERLRHMKDKRADFDKEDGQGVLDYCLTECRYMAGLTRKLISATNKAGIKLKTFHGAGSIASVILRDMGIDRAVRSSPPETRLAVASAFFGGRFEHLMIGGMKGPIYGYDISSAYPYQISLLPCLECGKWERTTKRADLKNATTAVVRYELGDAPKGIVWAPFPFRLKNGSIVFPAESGGGWVWLSEYLEGERLWPHVKFIEAWAYKTDCAHRPFAQLPLYYLKRLEWGKEGPGIVLKLGPNAGYGKLAQSIGLSPPFQSWVWAGMTTAGTRAQLLTLYGLHRDPRNFLMTATDGAYSWEKIETPIPLDTGTYNAKDRDGVVKPLGAWERKVVERGMFSARPGIYFPLEPTEADVKAVRARGVGRAAMLANWNACVSAYNEGKESVRIAEVSRFHGAKSSISRARIKDLPGQYNYTRGPLLDKDGNPCLDSAGNVRARFGQWSARPVELSFSPLPKREGRTPDGMLGIRYFPKDLVSVPYERSLMSEEASELKQATIEMLEQPDGDDFADYESDLGGNW
jgi:DNA polymerase type B, organellar and viral